MSVCKGFGRSKPNKMRKASVSAQLTRTARKFSAAIAPQLVRLDPITPLAKRRSMRIRIADIEQLQIAHKQYVLHNSAQFDPVEFEIFDEQTGLTVLNAHFYADELVLFEGSRRILAICFAEADPDSDENTLAKIRHPNSGIKVYEIIRSTNHSSFSVTNCMDEVAKCQMNIHSNCWRRMLSLCGCMFVPTYWTIDQEGINIGEVSPDGSFFEENIIRMEWCDETDMELRTLIICIGLIQMIREGFPSLLHILKETSKPNK